MEILWFSIVAFMMAMYVVLDGFDIGAGIVHLMTTRADGDRHSILKAIAPYWDGNEVWLLAGGGVLYFAFPMLYASSFSGFYLPLIMVLWLLMFRGLGIEFRHQIHHPLWLKFWDVVFSVSSILLAIFFGAALGNVVRGVPLDARHYFFEPLWTTFTVVPESGILDWFTVLMGLVALFTLTSHGAFYVAVKTEGGLRDRMHVAGRGAWWGTLITSILALVSVSFIRPEVWKNYLTAPWGYIFPLGGVLGIIGMYYFSKRGNDRMAFGSSCTFIISMLCATAFGLFPNLLISSLDPANSITVYNAAAQQYGLWIGFAWWIVGMILACLYFLFVFTSFKGKVSLFGEELY